MADEELDVKALYPLVKYLIVLVDSYPEPLRASELAKKTGHSKAAISKIREKLLKICDPNPMLFKKGFILSRSFNLLPSVFIVFLAHGQQKKFLSSRFFKSIVSGKRVHEKLSEAIPAYGERFTQEDSTFLIQKIIESLEQLPAKDFQLLSKILISKKPTAVASLASLGELQKTSKKLEFILHNEKELIQTIIIRDKFFFLIRDVLWSHMEDIQILKKMNESEKFMP